MSWWNSVNHDLGDSGGTAPATLSDDMAVDMDQTNGPVSGFGSRDLSTSPPAHSNSMKRNQTSPSNSNEAGITKRAKRAERLEQEIAEVAALTKKLEERDWKISQLTSELKQTRRLWMERGESWDESSEASSREACSKMTKEHEVMKGELEDLISTQAIKIEELREELRMVRVKQLEHTKLDEAERTIRSLRLQLQRSTQRQFDDFNELETNLRNAGGNIDHYERMLGYRRVSREEGEECDRLQTEVEALEDRIETLREKVDYCVNVEIAADDDDAMQHMVDDPILAPIISLRVLKAKQANEIQKLKKERDRAKDLCDQKLRDLQEMTEKYDTSQTEIRGLHNILSAIRTKVERVMDEACAAGGDDAKLQQMKLEDAAAFVALRNLNADIAIEIGKLNKERDGAKGSRRRTPRALERDEKYDDLQTEISDLKEFLETARGEADYCVNETSVARYALTELQMKHGEAEATITSLRTLNATQYDQIEQLQMDMLAADNKYKKLKQIHDKVKGSLESERLSGTRRAFRHRRAYRKMKHDAHSIRDQLDIAIAKRNELSARLSDTKAQLAETEDELQQLQADDDTEECLVVICVNLSIDTDTLRQIQNAYDAVILFLKVRWGSNVRVAVVAHGSEENEVWEACMVGSVTLLPVAGEDASGHFDYEFCLGEAQKILAQSAASKKVVVMIGDGQANSPDEPSLLEPIAYLCSNRIPAHSIIIHGEDDPDDIYRVRYSFSLAALTDEIGGWVEDQWSYISALEDMLG